ncbi:MAG: hypothetical protein NC095_01545 [Muribaculum sp.]|nr:hypothetical protein [Muribaculum sp.]
MLTFFSQTSGFLTETGTGTERWTSYSVKYELRLLVLNFSRCIVAGVIGARGVP